MPAANRARLADLGLQKLDPKKSYTKIGKNGLFVEEKAALLPLEKAEKQKFVAVEAATVVTAEVLPEIVEEKQLTTANVAPDIAVISEDLSTDKKLELEVSVAEDAKKENKTKKLIKK